MDRNAIHSQIATVVDKIGFLNERLSAEGSLHRVEIELLSGYARELNSLIEKLEETKNDLSVVNRKQEKPSVAEVKAVEKENIEIKMHQHILGNMEVKSIEDPEAVLEAQQEEEKITKESFKNQTIEEIVLKKKGVGKLIAPEDKTSVSLNEKFKKESKALADKLSVKKKKNPKDLFDLNERYAFIEKLFDGSADVFNKTIHDIGKCSTREEAEQYIKNVETKFSWNKKPALAERFTGHVLSMID